MRVARLAGWLGLAGAGLTWIAAGSAGPEPARTTEDTRRESVALFERVGEVLLHPRCVNCHPAGDTPRQGDQGQPHEPPVTRGRGGIGVIGMQCVTCHLDENFDPGGVPGAPHWRLAPAHMAWEGLDLGEICRQIKDPERNGGRTLGEIVEHLAEDDLVAWGWSPGAGREAVPGTHQEFGQLIQSWVDRGAECPE